MYGRGSNVFSSRRKIRWGRGILLFLVIAILATGVFVALDNGRVVVRTQRVFVSNLAPSLEGFTILHISDLNGKRFGPAQKQIANALKNRKYSAVCITGDMIGPKGDAYPFYELLSALDTTRPVFFIAGDSDPTPIGGPTAAFSSVMAEWVLGAQQSRGAIFLGAPQSLQVGKSTVWFTDATQLPLDLAEAQSAYASASTPISEYYAGVIAQTQAARAQMKEEDLHITLSHNPINREMVQTMQSVTGDDGVSFVRTVDLILAGGTVGGQWRLPFAGPVWSNGWFPGDEDTMGLQYAGSLMQYIGSGLGTNPKNPLPDFRLFNTAEMTLITFTGEMREDAMP